MPPRQNPLKLNPLQLRTLTLLQAIARLPNGASPGPGAGEITIDPRELADANWFSVDALPNIPPSISIARRLINDFIVAQGGQIE